MQEVSKEGEERGGKKTRRKTIKKLGEFLGSVRILPGYILYMGEEREGWSQGGVRVEIYEKSDMICWINPGDTVALL